MPQKNDEWESRYKTWRETDHGIEVFDKVIELGKKMLARGFQRYSMQLLVCVVRHHQHIKSGKDRYGLSINNNFVSYLSREAMTLGIFPENFFQVRN